MVVGLPVGAVGVNVLLPPHAAQISSAAVAAIGLTRRVAPMRPATRECIDVLSPLLVTTLLLTCSNVFMTFAWYAHLRNLSTRPWYVAVIVSWSIAFFEYILQVPANRVGYTVLTLSRLKILQEVLSLVVFVPFLVLYMRQPIKLDYLWSGLCLVGAVYFAFRS